MATLLNQYLDQFLIFVLVLTRVGALLMALPFIGSQSVPMQVRALLAVALSVVITPLHWGLTPPVPANLVDMAVILGREALLGLALGSAIMILLSGMQLAGQVISQMSGMSLSDVVNPTFDTQVPLFSHLLELVALTLFFLIGGDRQVMGALLGSFEWMPPGSGRLPAELTDALSVVAAHSFDTGLRAAAPIMVAMLLAILIVGLISRTLPQLNAIVIGMNLNALVVLAMLGLTLGSAAWVFQSATDDVTDLITQVFQSPYETTP
jgi:flagellar biosynthetic protein FliR